jgi:hypothetical protein
MATVSELVWLHVKRRPYLRETLKSGAANYSRLARAVSREIFGRQERFSATKAALIRIAARLCAEESAEEAKTIEVLKDTTISITGSVAAVTSSMPLKLDAIAYVKSGGTYTYIISEKEAVRVSRLKCVLSCKAGQNMLTLSSSKVIESTPGVASLILMQLASEGINVTELISAYTDTILIIRQSDTERAYGMLLELMGRK